MEPAILAVLCLIGVPILNTALFALLLLFYHEKFLLPIKKDVTEILNLLEFPEVPTITPPELPGTRKPLSKEDEAKLLQEVSYGQ